MPGHIYDCPLRFGFSGTPAMVRVLAHNEDLAFMAAFNLMRGAMPGQLLILTGERPRRVAGAA